MVSSTAAKVGSKVSVVCPCGARGIFPQRLAGRKIKCRECREVLRVPAARAEVMASNDTQRWLMQDSDDEVILTPLATSDADELRLLPPHERKLWDENMCRPGMRRSPGEVRMLEQRAQAGGLFRRGANSAAPPPSRSRGRSSGSRTGPAYRTRNPNVRHHGHVKAIAFWYQASGVLLGLSALLGSAAGVALGGAPGWLIAATFCIGLGMAGLNWGLGYGLSRLYAWGRWVTVALTGLNAALSVVSLFAATGVGTLLVGLLPVAWNAAVLWALLGTQAWQVFGREYQAPRRVPFIGSPFFWIPAAVIVLSIFAALALIVASLVIV